MNLWMYSYKNGSKTAKAIAAELGIKLIKHRESQFVGDEDITVLNWGCTDLPREVRKCRIINNENSVWFTVDKLVCLYRMQQWHGLPHVPFTDDRAEAWEWIKERKAVVCRTNIKGKDGDGIVFATEEEELVDAPLYTLFTPAQDEYRVTVYGGKLICRQRKVRIPGKEHYDDRFKTTAGGYGFEVVPLIPRPVADAARDAVDCLGLTFGGVDVIRTPEDQAVVLEVNSAPQLTPFALRKFVEAVRQEVMEFDEV